MCLTKWGLLQSESVILVRRPLQRSRLQNSLYCLSGQTEIALWRSCHFLVLRELRDAVFNLSVLASDMWSKSDKLMLFPDFNSWKSALQVLGLENFEISAYFPYAGKPLLWLVNFCKHHWKQVNISQWSKFIKVTNWKNTLSKMLQNYYE